MGKELEDNVRVKTCMPYVYVCCRAVVPVCVSKTVLLASPIAYRLVRYFLEVLLFLWMLS